MDIGEIKFFCRDFDNEITIKGYFKELLCTLWKEQDGFSGKRPFGNSGWDYDIYAALILAGAIEGELDENGYIDEMSKKQEGIGNALIIDYIVEVL
jgi:hypothetical protein